MDLRQSYKILGLRFGADLEKVKAAFRTRAREFHPDLHPEDPLAAQKFHDLNKAYIYLREYLVIKEARLQKNARTGTGEDTRQNAAKTPREENQTLTEESTTRPRGFAARQEEALKKVLDDPFARQVFEDIFEKIKRRAPKISPSPEKSIPKKNRGTIPAGKQPPRVPEKSAGMVPGIKKWIGSRLDAFQTIHLPADQLLPGNRVRVSVQGKKPRHIDIRLPATFKVGRSLRVKDQGRTLGPLKGDLYLRFLPSD